MASGDAQRVWFPEMLDELRAAWSAPITWSELATLCEQIAVERRALRASRGIEPPTMRCSKCGAVSRSDLRGVTIRSALFALLKMGVVDEAGFRALDKGWMKHRAANQLDRFGRRAEAEGGVGVGWVGSNPMRLAGSRNNIRVRRRKWRSSDVAATVDNPRHRVERCSHRPEARVVGGPHVLCYAQPRTAHSYAPPGRRLRQLRL